ncbi:unnamed protein product [Meganyctiphanes norvegica]|uniref:Uncharacterized protein n=1 Tax=Meganyctiphanes norvegica TaxID=48144 RepID=A0AAV2QWE9_MEGNR
MDRLLGDPDWNRDPLTETQRSRLHRQDPYRYPRSNQPRAQYAPISYAPIAYAPTLYGSTGEPSYEGIIPSPPVQQVQHQAISYGTSEQSYDKYGRLINKPPVQPTQYQQVDRQPILYKRVYFQD